MQLQYFLPKNLPLKGRPWLANPLLALLAITATMNLVAAGLIFFVSDPGSLIGSMVISLVVMGLLSIFFNEGVVFLYGFGASLMALRYVLAVSDQPTENAYILVIMALIFLGGSCLTATRSLPAQQRKYALPAITLVIASFALLTQISCRAAAMRF